MKKEKPKITMEHYTAVIRGMLLCGGWIAEVSVITGIHHMTVNAIYNDLRREGKLK